MDKKQIIKFWRFTFQGLAIAAWGTMGLTPDWGSFVLGLVAIAVAVGESSSRTDSDSGFFVWRLV